MSETICHKFLETVQKQSNRTAVMYKRGSTWQELNWMHYRELVETLAGGLQTLGIRKGDRVAILANSCLEWAVTDLAILGLGAVTVPIYQSSTPEDVEFILANSESRLLFCESHQMVRKLQEVFKKTKTLEKVICFERLEKSEASPSSCLTIDELQVQGAIALKRSPTLYELAVRELRLADIATIIYTSGTTGRPKGVVLTHTQAMSEASEAFPLLGATVRDRALSFLPYAHVLGRIEIWGHALIGHTLAFAQGIEHLKNNLIEVKPTFIIAVPRVFEKIYNGILQQAEISPLRSRTFKWAISIGGAISRYKVGKQPIPLDLAIQYQLARRLVFNSIAEKMGGQLRFAVCGGAPLSRPIAEFFHAAGLLVLEGYGLTETTAAITVNTPFDYRFGSVGKPIGEVRIKIADDGEVLVQSKKVMREYYKDKDATSHAFTDGWFHTGDIGEISPEGYLTITDRKKDLIKTAGGKYVAPQKLEGLLKANRLISQVHIHGDQKKYVIALLTLNWDSVSQVLPGADTSPAGRNLLIDSPKLKELLRKAVADTNAHLASYESIKNFAILPNELTIEAGELTPSLKIKRKVVDTKYNDLIARLYGE